VVRAVVRTKCDAFFCLELCTIAMHFFIWMNPRLSDCVSSTSTLVHLICWQDHRRCKCKASHLRLPDAERGGWRRLTSSPQSDGMT
jgi:hypothetical protein